MKKVLIMMMCVIMVVCFMPTVAMADETPSVQDGTKLHPYIVDSAENLATVLSGAGAPGAENTFISITKDIDMTGKDWEPVYINGYNGADIITIQGNGHTITGLNAPLFSGGFAGGSGLVIDGLTIYKATINDTTNTQGIGAFISCVDSMNIISLTSCHLVNSTIESTGGARVGGLIGWTAGYDNPNDGPVDTYINVTNCSVENTSITAAGSVGAIIGHAGSNSATYHTIKNCTVTGCTLTSTDTDGWRVGVAVGTANIGQVTIENITESNNTLTQLGASSTKPEGESNLYGRFVPGNTGVLVVNGTVIGENGSNYVAYTNGRCYTTLAEAINAAQPGSVVTLLKDVTVNNTQTSKNSGALTIDGKSITIDGGNHKITAGTGFTTNEEWTPMKNGLYHMINILNGADVTLKNLTIDGNWNNTETDDNAVRTGVNVFTAAGDVKQSKVTLDGVTINNCSVYGLVSNGSIVIANNLITEGNRWGVNLDNQHANMKGDFSMANGALNEDASLVIENHDGAAGTTASISGGTYKEVGIKPGNTNCTLSITGGTFSTDPKEYVASGYTVDGSGPFTVKAVSSGIPSLPPTTPTDNVTNSGSTTTDNASTNADLSNTTSTSNGTTTATVDKTTADKIVDKAVENKSTEVVIDATANSTTAADSTTIAQVTIPTETLGAIAEKTEADVTIKTDVAEVKMNNAAAAAVSEQAEGDTVQIIAEKVKEDATEVHFELKVVSSDGKVISDFKGGNVAVTVALPKAMADKKVVCVYIDDNGHMSKVAGQKNADGTYTFNTGHFSSYAIMAEEEADAAIAAQKEAIKNIKIKLTSKQVKTKAGKKAVKITWTAAAGDKVLDGVEVFRSTERYKGYGTEPFYTSTKGGNTGSYTNTKSLKKGTKYYYRVRGYVLVDGQKVYTDYSTKAWRTVK